MNKEIIARNAACNAIVALVDTGTTNPTGQLFVYDDSTNVLARLPFDSPAFLSAVDGTSLSNPLTDSTVVMDGTATSFSVVNRDSTKI